MGWARSEDNDVRHHFFRHVVEKDSTRIVHFELRLQYPRTLTRNNPPEQIEDTKDT